MRYFTPGKSLTLPPLTKTTECSCKLWSIPGIKAVISTPEVNRTLATLRKAEFGFLGVIVEKLTDKSPLLPLYRTVHEIFTSYGSSFNSFEFIGFFSAFENPPSSTPSRRVTRTNHVFMFQLNTFHCFLIILLKKGEDYSLYKTYADPITILE